MGGAARVAPGPAGGKETGEPLTPEAVMEAWRRARRMRRVYDWMAASSKRTLAELPDDIEPPVALAEGGERRTGLAELWEHVSASGGPKLAFAEFLLACSNYERGGNS